MEKYEFLSRTGEGAYGSVWRARDKNTGVLVAVKKMKDVPSTEEEGEIAMREVRVLQLAKHVNVVNLMEAYKSQSGRLYLVFEYVERTLLQELKANRSGLPPAVVKSTTWQLLQALSFLHRKQIIHRDVKPSNILLTESGVLKICDFGFARACSNATADPAYTTYVVTRWYRPPEVLVGDTYGTPVDIWALGCIFAEMLVGRPLFPGKNHHDQLWLILKCLGRMTERQLDLLDADPQFACFRLPTQSEVDPLENRVGNVGAAAMQVLRACLHPDPKQRASADELLAMPFFQGVTETLPVSDLMAYPDADMRLKLEKAVALDQAAAAPPARDSTLLLSSSRRQLAPTNKQQPLQPLPAPASTASTSPPSVPTPQQEQQQQHPGSLPAPCKAASAAAPKSEPCPDANRPPLQRHITAPPGSMSGRLHGQALPLQPLSDHSLGVYVPQSQRLRRSGDGTQHISPSKAQSAVTANAMGVLIPPRGRHWRGSGDGASEFAAGPPAVRQLSGSHLLPPHSSAALGLSGTNGPVPPDPCRLAPEALLRPPTQRISWNGASSGPRAAGSGGSGGGASGHGTPSGSLATSQSHSNPPVANDAAPMHRRAHSLAGSDPNAPVNGGNSGGRGTPGFGGVQGRSLAPHPGPGMGCSSSSNNGLAGQGLQLPLPTVSAPNRLTPSPPPGGYGGGNGGLRITSSAPMNLPPGFPSSRSTHDGCNILNAPPHLVALGCRPQPISISSIAAASAGPHNSGSHAPSGGIESEASDGSGGEVPVPNNDGRRASDTVLYATLALNNGRQRLDKSSSVTPGAGRQPPCVLDGPLLVAPSGGSGGGAHPFGTPRVPSFSRNSGPPAIGPSSPECAMPANLPPLQNTPQRRISAPEPTAMAVLGTGAGMVCGSACGISRGASSSMLPGNNSGYPQRHGLKHPHPGLGHQQSSNCDSADCGDGAANAHVFLPVLEVGPAGKAARVPVGTTPGVGVVRRPSRSNVRLVAAEVAHCKREEASKALALEAVPEAGVL